MEITPPTKRITEAYERGAWYIRQANAKRKSSDQPWGIEPLDVALAVEQYRWAWRPTNPSVVLIAESHVFTTAADLASQVVEDRLPEGLRRGSSEFVRLVYCPGYGENAVLTSGVADNTGTPDFWNLFGRIAGTGTHPSGTSLEQRLEWKASTLMALQVKGVWLLDASVHALYAPGGLRAPSALGKDLHNVWWTYYGHHLLEQLPAKAHKWVIGKGVYDQLSKLGARPDGYIYQPRAARSKTIDMQHGWDDLLADVDRGWKANLSELGIHFS